MIRSRDGVTVNRVLLDNSARTVSIPVFPENGKYFRVSVEWTGFRVFRKIGDISVFSGKEKEISVFSEKIVSVLFSFSIECLSFGIEVIFCKLLLEQYFLSTYLILQPP